MPKCSKKGPPHDLLTKYGKPDNVPKEWKHAIVLPFLKENKDPTNPNSYKSDSVDHDNLQSDGEAWLPIVSTGTWRRIICSIKIRPDFDRKRSTIDQVMRLQNDVINGLNNMEIYAWPYSSI